MSAGNAPRSTFVPHGFGVGAGLATSCSGFASKCDGSSKTSGRFDRRRGSDINSPRLIKSSWPFVLELEYCRNGLTQDSYGAKYPPLQVFYIGLPDNAYNVIRYANSDVSDTETVARSTSRLPNPVFSQSPLQFSSQHIPPESGSVLGTSTARFANPEQETHSSTEDITCQGDCCYSRELLPSARGCDAPSLKYHLDLPSTPSQPSVTSPKGTIGPLFHGTPVHPVIFTDDAKMKLGNRVRRQCFNCRSTTTKAWRRSVLSPGKMVCLV